LASLES